MSDASSPLVAILMGSSSDWPNVMRHASELLDELGVPHEVRAISAHRAPDLLHSYTAELEDRGIELIIAGAGLAAHLPGVTAALTPLPVLGVPIDAGSFQGMDAVMSILQMPPGVPVGTLGVGKVGAKNAALLASSILGGKHPEIRERYRAYRRAQTERVVAGHDKVRE